METGGGEWRCEGGGEFDKPDLLMLLYTWSSPHQAAAATLFMMLFVIIFSWHFAPSSPFYHCRAALLYLYSMKTLFKPTPLVTLTVQLYVLFYLQGYQQLLMHFICVWGAFKDPKSNFKPVHFALYFGNFTLLVLKVILASKLSELEEFKNRAANNQIARKRMKMRLKSNRCYCRQALKQMFLGWVMLIW